MRLSAADCLRRGLANVRANWELVPLHWAGVCLVAGLLAAGLVLPLFVLGFDLLAGRRATPAQGAEMAAAIAQRVLARLAHASPALLAAGVGLLALWLLALLVYCFVQAGTYGVLAAADRQALPGAARDWRWFRTFTLHDFLGWGGRYLWRYFWLLVVAALLGLLLVTLAALWMLAIAAGAARWGTGAAFGIGCGGALPLFFALVVLRVWLEIARADLPREESGVGAATSTGFEVLGRRLGAVILLVVLFVLASAFVSFVFLLVSLAFDAALRGQPLARGAATVLVTVLQWVPLTFAELALGGALVALVRSEAVRGAVGLDQTAQSAVVLSESPA